MPYYCIVPKCKNKSGTPGLSFHQLPLKKRELLKLWLIKIKRKNPPLTRHSRVCSAHFKDGKKKGKNDVPCVFAWTRQTSRAAPKTRRNPERRKIRTTTIRK